MGRVQLMLLFTCKDDAFVKSHLYMQEKKKKTLGKYAVQPVLQMTKQSQLLKEKTWNEPKALQLIQRRDFKSGMPGVIVVDY